MAALPEQLAQITLSHVPGFTPHLGTSRCQIEACCNSPVDYHSVIPYNIGSTGQWRDYRKCPRNIVMGLPFEGYQPCRSCNSVSPHLEVFGFRTHSVQCWNVHNVSQSHKAASGYAI
jgi:hypothetical protein